MIIGIYVVSLLFDSGIRKIEEATNIQKSAEKRLEIIRQIMDGGRVGDIIAVHESMIYPENETQFTRSFNTQTKLYLKTGDPVSSVLLALGNPESKERYQSFEVYRYNHCNVTISNDIIIGWSIR